MKIFWISKKTLEIQLEVCYNIVTKTLKCLFAGCKLILPESHGSIFL